MACARRLGFLLHIGTTHNDYVVVSIVVQNLVGIDAVVLITCRFLYIVC